MLARLAGRFGLLVIAAMVSVGLGDLPGLVQQLFILVVFGRPVLLAAVPTRRRPSRRGSTDTRFRWRSRAITGHASGWANRFGVRFVLEP